VTSVPDAGKNTVTRPSRQRTTYGGAAGPVDLDDLAVTLLVALVATLDGQFVSHLCSHDRPPRDVIVIISLKGRGHPRQGRWSR